MNKILCHVKTKLTAVFFCSILSMAATIMPESNNTQPPVFEIPTFKKIKTPRSVIIVIPAYNEEKRITETLLSYLDYFKKCKNVSATFLVVCNNCSDKTPLICKNLQKKHSELHFLDLKPGGKGFAVKQGFLKALEYQNADYIGFVDADMATKPPYFYQLITEIQGHDGAIASRYKKGARVWPNRPFVKIVGGKFYNWVLRKNFHLDIRDTQCGAKLFTYDTIKKAAPHMQETRWAWDLEFLYICQLYDKDIVEVATTWSDMPGSSLTISGCYKEFITAPTRIKKQQEKLAKKMKRKKDKAKKAARELKRLERKNHDKKPQFMAAKQ